MRQGILRALGCGACAMLVAALCASGASASIAPALKLDQSDGTAAGSTANLGLDLTFAPTGTDSPDHMSLSLPPGLLANAAVNGGTCLTTTDLNDAACEVGSGTVTAKAYGSIPITTPVTFDLVPPPAPGDLAGLAVNSSGTQVGSTADIKVRPSGDPGGVGVTITFVLPNNLYGVPISITEIKSTFDGLRYPTSCPATPQSLSVAVDSYGDATVRTVTAPLSVTRCASLPYSPAFAVTATRDSADDKVKLVTQITQAAAEAPSRSVSLAFPYPMLAPNIQAVGVLCPTLSSSCTPVGSVTAASPLYPKPLTGQAYLTGTVSGLSLTMAFPAPFPLTLTGAVSLTTNTTTFNGLPDIPLTELAVTLTSGAHALFGTACRPSAGTANAVLTDQNGDRTVKAPAQFTIAGCPSSPGGSTSGGSGGTGGPTGGHGAGSLRMSAARLAGLGSGRPSLSFRLAAAGGAKLRALVIELPSGLGFRRHRVGGRLLLTGVTLIGAKAKSLALSHGHLAVVLRAPVSVATIRLSPSALSESASLRAQARSGHLGALFLTVIAQTANGQHSTIRARLP